VSASLQITGLDALLERLGGMKDERLLEAAAKGLKDGLEVAAAEAAALCPKDTGALAASIGARVSREDGRLSGEVYAGKAYAVHVEMGTQAQPARPFLYPAFKANQQKTAQGIARAVGGLLGNGEM